LGWQADIYVLVIQTDFMPPDGLTSRPNSSLLHHAMAARALVISCQTVLRPGRNRSGLALCRPIKHVPICHPSIAS
jgi:hypothetical protein